jgi:hypothetical protein
MPSGVDRNLQVFSDHFHVVMVEVVVVVA